MTVTLELHVTDADKRRIEKFLGFARGYRITDEQVQEFFAEELAQTIREIRREFP
jgi:hypothetical protein